MKRIILQKNKNGYYKLFDNRFTQIANNSDTLRLDLSKVLDKLKFGDKIEIRKIKR